jgi:hypothetical protein
MALSEMLACPPRPLSISTVPAKLPELTDRNCASMVQLSPGASGSWQPFCRMENSDALPAASPILGMSSS